MNARLSPVTRSPGGLPIVRSSKAADLAVSLGLAAAVVAAAWSAFQQRNLYWSWLFPASLAVGLFGVLSLRLPVVRQHADELVSWNKGLIVVGLALVGLFGSTPVFAIRVLIGLVGPAVIVYQGQLVARHEREAQELTRETEQVARDSEAMVRDTQVLSALNAMTEAMTADAQLAQATAQLLLRHADDTERHRRGPRVAGRRRHR